MAGQGRLFLSGGGVVDPDFAARVAGGQKRSVSAEGYRLHRPRLAFELAHQIHVVVSGSPVLVFLGFINAEAAFGPPIGSPIFARVPHHAVNGLKQFVHVVDELAIGGVDEFHRPVPTGAQETSTIGDPSGSEHPVAVVVELHQFLAVRDAGDPNTLVRSAGGDTGAIRRPGETEEGIRGQAKRLGFLGIGDIPDLDLAESRRSAAAHTQRFSIRRERHGFDAWGFSQKARGQLQGHCIDEQNLMVTGHCQSRAVRRHIHGTDDRRQCVGGRFLEAGGIGVSRGIILGSFLNPPGDQRHLFRRQRLTLLGHVRFLAGDGGDEQRFGRIPRRQIGPVFARLHEAGKGGGVDLALELVGIVATVAGTLEDGGHIAPPGNGCLGRDHMAGGHQAQSQRTCEGCAVEHGKWRGFHGLGFSAAGLAAGLLVATEGSDSGAARVRWMGWVFWRQTRSWWVALATTRN